MMATFALFGSGYIMRPLGAVFFGHVGDLLGRKYSLLITIFTMTMATTAIGLIPTHWSYATLYHYPIYNMVDDRLYELINSPFYESFSVK